MANIELFPSPDHHIETTATDEFCNSPNQYVECAQKDKKLEGKIELLRAFLESADVRKPRSDGEIHMIEANRVKSVVGREQGKPSYEMAVTEDLTRQDQGSSAPQFYMQERIASCFF